jgi:hypothetical protein
VLGRVRPYVIGGVLVAVACVLFSPPIAQAHRKPTARERAAITGAAVRTDGTPTRHVRVRRIKVSTVGPSWAVAVVTLTLDSAPKHPTKVFETFYRSHGRWMDVFDPNTPQHTPPRAVLADLGLPTGPADGGHHRNSSDGGSHRTLIIVGSVIVGLLLLAGLFGWTSDTTTGQPITGPPVDRKPAERSGREPDRPRKCNSCHGEKRKRCANECHMGYGPQSGRWVSDPLYPDGRRWEVCGSCRGRHEWDCERCNGSGLAPAYG